MSKRSETKARELRDGVRHLVVAHGVLDAHTRPCGTAMPLPRAHALLEMLASEEPLTVSVLAQRLAIDRTNVSRLCARMEADGELVKVPDPDDARARVVRLTARGRRLAEKTDARSVEHFGALVRELGPAHKRVVAALAELQAAMTELAERKKA